mgnify:CR=1 FL=1
MGGELLELHQHRIELLCSAQLNEAEEVARFRTGRIPSHRSLGSWTLVVRFKCFELTSEYRDKI